MVKQRQESARAYEEGGRLELAEKERAEIGVIEGFLPRQLSEEEVARAIDAAIDRTGASTIRDMGRRYPATPFPIGGFTINDVELLRRCGSGAGQERGRSARRQIATASRRRRETRPSGRENSIH